MLGKSCRWKIFSSSTILGKEKGLVWRVFGSVTFTFVHVIIATNLGLESRLTNEILLRDIEIQTDLSMLIEEFYLRLFMLPIQVRFLPILPVVIVRVHDAAKLGKNSSQRKTPPNGRETLISDLNTHNI